MRPLGSDRIPAVLHPLLTAALLFATTSLAYSQQVTTVEERDASGAVRVERQVRLNVRGDFENHGVYRAWSPQGQLVGQGRYTSGRKTGVWRRWATASEAPPATAALARGFAFPLVSQATYRDGLIEGKWRIADAEGRVLVEIDFKLGDRDGLAVVYDVGGRLVRRSRFSEGQPNGAVERLQNSGELVEVANYHDGRERYVAYEQFADGRLCVKQSMLGPEIRLATPDDPWELQLATYTQHGEALRNGDRVVWHANGRVKMRAHFVAGRADGPVSWWGDTGQIATEGRYSQGLAAGEWRWWHPNGMPAARATFAAGDLIGEASSWEPSGRKSPVERPKLQVAGQPSDTPPPR